MIEDESPSKYSDLSKQDQEMLNSVSETPVQQPEDSDENTTEQLDDERVLKIEFDDGSFVEIPYMEKVVKFPEDFVEKTAGVEGYVRKSIPWEAIIPVLEDIFPSSELIRRIQEMPVKNRRIEDYRDLVYNNKDSLYSSENLYHLTSALDALKRNQSDCQEQIAKLEKFFDELLEKLAPGFMTKCNLHYMGTGEGRAGGILEQGKENLMIDKFKSQMLTERVADPSVVAHVVGSSSSVPRGVLMYWLYDQKTDEYVHAKSLRLPHEIADYLHFDWDESDPDAFLASVRERGYYIQSINMSVSYGGMWGGDGWEADHQASALVGLGSPVFAFSPGNKGFVSYLNSVKNNLSKNRPYDEDFQYLNILSDPGRNVKYSKGAHPTIPTILAHPKIPELRWCHAQYAYIPTSKNLNICEMISREMLETGEHEV